MSMPPLLPSHRLARFYILDFGLFDVGPGLRTIGIPGFLLETDAGARILFDTGFPPDYVTAPDATAARDGLHRFGAFARFGAENTAAGQLALLGLTPADISHVILSHGHIDHVGSLLRPIPLREARAARAAPTLTGSSIVSGALTPTAHSAWSVVAAPTLNATRNPTVTPTQLPAVATVTRPTMTGATAGPTIVQQASGTFDGSSFTPTLAATSSTSNLIVLIVTGNTIVTTPSGFTLRTSQVNYMGQYL